MKQHRTLTLIVFLVIIFSAGFYYYGQRRNSTVSPHKFQVVAEKRDFQITVRIVGVLHAAKSHMISSQLGGNEGKIIYLIGDGEQVEKDEILIRLDPAPFADDIEQQKAHVESFSAAVEASKQLLEWEKNEVQQQITTAQYNLKVAKLERERLINGDGPLKLTQYQDEMEKARLDLSKYQAYTKDLLALQEKGFDNPAEISQAQENVVTYQEKFSAAKRRYISFEKYVLPAMIESAHAKVQNSELSLRQTGQSGVHKIAKAKATFNQIEGKLRATQTALNQATVKLERTVIKAPFAGLVIHHETFRNGQLRKPREGDNVIMNQSILYLPDISKMLIKGLVREVDLHKIAIGQRAAISVEAYPDTDFHGSLSFIGALASRRNNNNRQGGEKYFQVTFTLEDGDERLRPGMTAKVVIFSAQLKDVLAVPIQAVFYEGGASYCYKKNKKKAQKIAVKLGRQNEHFVEILAGLSTGDMVSVVKPQK